MENSLYEKFAKMFPQVESGDYSYLKLESGGLEPVTVERFGMEGDQVAIMQTYTMNGDLMYDPMITFDIDSEMRTMNATEFQQSMPPLYQRVDENGDGNSIDGNGNEYSTRNLRSQIEEFSSFWLDNISASSFMPVQAIMKINNEDVDVSFDKDGNVIVPDEVNTVPSQEEKPLNIPCYTDEGKFIRQFAVLNECVKDVATELKNNDVDFSFTDGYTDYLTFFVIPNELDAPVCKDILNKLNVDNLFGLSEEKLRPLAEESHRISDLKSKSALIDVKSLPDSSLRIEDMIIYGYEKLDMYPLSNDKALKLFDMEHPIYLLYPDNTELLALDRNEIITFNEQGFCGITKADWESSPIFAGQIAIAANAEGKLEADLLYGDENKFGIYQIKNSERTFRFTGMTELKDHGLPIDRANYELVYTAPFPERLELFVDSYYLLNKIYNQFNTDHPDDYTARSVSISDVIVLQYEGQISSHFVDRVGFVEVDNFLGEQNERESVNQKAEHTPILSEPLNDSNTLNAKSEKINKTDDNSKHKSTISKDKPSLLGKLEQNKQRTTQQEQPPSHKNKGLEV